jgi:AbiV family abortive infection protein
VEETGKIFVPRSHKNKPGETLTLSNSTRLLVDARFLLDNDRFASAFALAVLGVEEIGKVLLDGWNADAPLAKPKASFHIQKQTAVSSLLLGALAVRTYPEGSIVAGDKLKSLTKMFNESVEGRLFMLIQQQELDKRKQAALYQDDWLTSAADDFAEEHVNSIFKIVSDARDAIDDKFIRRVVGRAFYELTFGRRLGHQLPSKIAAQAPPLWIETGNRRLVELGLKVAGLWLALIIGLPAGAGSGSVPIGFGLFLLVFLAFGVAPAIYVGKVKSRK